VQVAINCTLYKYAIDHDVITVAINACE